MTHFSDIYKGGATILVQGPPSTGKSWLMGSVCELDDVDPERVCLICLRPKERESYQYVRFGLKANVIIDRNWKPDLDRHDATGYTELLNALDHLYTSDAVDVVIVDPLTAINDLIAHDILKREKAATPKDFSDPRDFWGMARNKTRYVLDDLTALATAPHPKHVLASVHTKPVEEEGTKSRGGPPQKHADRKAKGVRYEGEVLPMIDGSTRYDVAGYFSTVLYTTVDYDLRQRPPAPIYKVQVRADKERFAKIALAPSLEEQTLPNDLVSVFTAVAEALAEREDG